ncbi:MAG: hypothetical protein HKN90_02030 [Flavobacteriaceae bacterium]|nr:hypothetical protein [Flavobacteriaceae bacterium]
MKQKKLDIMQQKGSGFKVPEGYFNTIEDAILSEIKTEKFPNTSGFSVPDGYFESLEQIVNSKLIIDQLPDKEGFNVPKDYFDSIEDTIFTKLGKETLSVNSKEIPKDYFDTLEDRVFARLKDENIEKETKVISLGARIRKVWVPIAVAASLVLIFMIGYNDGSDTGLNDVATAEVDQWIEEDLINLDSYEIAEVFSDIELASGDVSGDDDELLNYLNGTDVESMLLEN